jgi:hypothetical protein
LGGDRHDDDVNQESRVHVDEQFGHFSD